MRRTSAVLALLDEAVSGLVRARGLTAVSVAVIGVSLFIVGVFFLVAENLKGVVEAVRQETAVTVFLKPDATEADRLELERLAQASGLVVSFRPVNPEEARARFSTWWRSLAAAAESLPANPFPASLELELTHEAASSAALPPLLASLAAGKGVEEVQYDAEWVRRLRGTVALARAGGTALALFLVAGAAFTIANVVRLTILLHRDEIEILRLVGAPELLIRGPFLLGGLAQGLLGGLVALGLLVLVWRGVLLWVVATQNALLLVFGVRFLPPATVALLVAGGLLAGLVGGGIAVRRRNLS